MLPWQQMQREIASLQNTLSQQQQQSGSSKGKGRAASGRGAGRGPGSHQCLRRGEDRAGWLWRDKVCRGGRLAVKWRCHSSHSCSVVVKTLISTHTVCCLSRGVTSCELSPKKGNPPGIFTTSQQTWEALGCSL